MADEYLKGILTRIEEENKGPAPVPESPSTSFAWSFEEDWGSKLRPFCYDDIVGMLAKLSTHQLFELRATLSTLACTEPFFILRGQDASASRIVRVWIDTNLNNKAMRPNKILRASQIARAMDQWKPRKEAD